MYEFVIFLKYHENCVKNVIDYTFKCYDFNEFKQELLKNFGNFQSVNRLNKQKHIFKELVKMSENLKQLCGLIKINTDFEIVVKVKEVKNNV